VFDPWRIAGTYLESCNCDAICPCRRIAGKPGGRSTHGICMGALSWHVERGEAAETDLSGLNIVLACRYSDDEDGSPWTFVLYVDEEGSAEQRAALEAIFLGRAAGTQVEHFPWAWKASNLLAVEPAHIELDHTPRRRWFRVGDTVSVRIAGVVEDQETVTCIIPGHEQQGEEVVAEELRVAAATPLSFELRGVCGYASVFEYASAP
jgi:hypothetical protein